MKGFPCLNAIIIVLALIPFEIWYVRYVAMIFFSLLALPLARSWCEQAVRPDYRGTRTMPSALLGSQSSGKIEQDLCDLAESGPHQKSYLVTLYQALLVGMPPTRFPKFPAISKGRGKCLVTTNVSRFTWQRSNLIELPQPLFQLDS